MKRLGWLLFAHVLLIFAPGARSAAVSPPTDFAGAAISTDQVTWSWNGSIGASRYVLHDQFENEIAQITDTGALVYSFTEDGLDENTQYSRHVHALGGGELSPASNMDARFTLIHTATTADFSVTPMSTTVMAISVVPPPNATEAQTGVKVLRTSPSSGEVSPFSQAYDVMEHDLQPETQYCYTIQFQNGDGIPSGFPASPNCNATMPVETPPPPPFEYCAVTGIDGPIYLYLGGTKKVDGKWEVLHFGTGTVEWQITRATEKIDIRKREGAKFEPYAKGEGKVIKTTIQKSGVYLIEAKCKDDKVWQASLFVGVFDFNHGEKCALKELRGPGGLCMKAGGTVKEKWMIVGDNLKNPAKDLDITLTPGGADAAIMKVTGNEIHITFKKYGDYELKVACKEGDPPLTLTKKICITELKSISGPTRITLDSKVANPTFMGRWNANLDPKCVVHDLNWKIKSGTTPEKGTGEVAIATVKKAGTYTITFSCGEAQVSLEFKVTTGGALKVSGPKLKIKPVEALGPTDKHVDETALAAQRAIPRKARWLVTSEGEVTFTWYILRLPDDAHGTDQPPEPTVKNTSKTGTGSPIEFDCLTPGCYVIVIIGAQAEGAYSGYVQGDVPNGAHRFVVVESDLDVVIDCDQSPKVSQPHALPKLYPETVVGTPDTDDLVKAAPTLSCCTGLRFRLMTVPTFTLQFPGGVLTADDDKSGFTGFSTKPESCDSTSSRKDFFKLFAEAGGSLTISVKTPNGDVLPYVKIDYKVPAPKREVTLNFYFVQGSDATKATSALAGAGAADQDAYCKEAVENANAYWSQIGICFSYVNRGKRAVDVPNPTPGGSTGDLSKDLATKNNVFVVPNVTDPKMGVADIDAYPNMRIILEDPHPDCSDNAAATLAHELLHGMAGLDAAHTGMGDGDLGGEKSPIEGSNVSGTQTTTATTNFDNKK